jgi:hypothetical protein
MEKICQHCKHWVDENPRAWSPDFPNDKYWSDYKYCRIGPKKPNHAGQLQEIHISKSTGSCEHWEKKTAQLTLFETANHD